MRRTSGKKRLGAVLTAVAGLSWGLAGAGARPAEASVMGANGMVVTSHPLAAQAGLRILQAGGNAFDAAVASAAGLHLRFDADDDAPWFTMSERDAPIWEEEVVEIFLDPVGDGRYVEVEVNPAGVVCDLRRLGPGESGSDEIPVPAGVMDRGFDVAGLEVSVTESNDGWTATAFLPWRGLDLEAPPRPGTTMAFNVFRIKRPGGPEAPAEGAVFAAWSPTGGPSFHAPDAFRPLRLLPAPEPPSPR